MKIQFLGTGNAAQVPVFGCKCPACQRARAVKSHVRGPSCCVVEVGNQRYLIDAGHPNLAHYIEQHPVNDILLSHFHVDHVQGLFHLRWGVGEKIEVWNPDDQHGCADLYQHPGLLSFNRVKPFTELSFGSLKVTPVPLNHSKHTLGYCLEYHHHKAAYLCDTKGLPDDTFEHLLKWGPDVIIIDTTFAPVDSNWSDGVNRNHNCISEVEQLIELFEQRSEGYPTPTFWLTHISHQLDCYLMEPGRQLHPKIKIALDNLTIDMDDIEPNFLWHSGPSMWSAK